MRKGIIALPTIILIGGIVLEIALTLSLVSYFLLQSGAGSRFAAEALNMAQAGVDDALVRIVRTDNFKTDGEFYSYTVTMDATKQSYMTICNGYEITSANDACDTFGSTHESNKLTINSLGKSFNKYRKLQAIVNINSNNGEIKVKSIQEIPL